MHSFFLDNCWGFVVGTAFGYSFWIHLLGTASWYSFLVQLLVQLLSGPLPLSGGTKKAAGFLPAKLVMEGDMLLWRRYNEAFIQGVESALSFLRGNGFLQTY